MIGGLGLDSESSLWLTPLLAGPEVPKLFPFDLVYLDQDQRVIHGIEVVPGVDLPPYSSQVASALILPERTLSSTNTIPGDQLRVCEDEEMIAQLGRISAAAVATPITNAPAEKPSILHMPIQTDPVEIKMCMESPYELFPSPIIFMPALTAGVQSTGFQGKVPEPPFHFVSQSVTGTVESAESPSPPIANPEAPTTESAGSADESEGPSFFVPQRIRFFDPAAQASVDEDTNAPQNAVPNEEDFDARRSSQLSSELRAVISELTAKEKEKQREKRGETPKQQKKKKKARPGKDPTEIAKAVPRIKEPQEQRAEPEYRQPANVIPISTPSQKQKDETIAGRAEEAPHEAKSKTREKLSLTTRFQRWLDAGSDSNRRKSSRVRSPGLVAYYWSGGTPKPYQIADISASGFYLLTEDRWVPQTMLRVTLQRPDKEEGHPRHSITVLAKVVRVDSTGAGHEFVMTESLNRRTLDILPDQGTDRKALERFLQPLQ